jgi:hypothetical protein
MTFFENTIVNNGSKVNLTVAKKGGTDKISEFFKSKLPWDMTFIHWRMVIPIEKEIIGNSLWFQPMLIWHPNGN